MKNIFVFCLLLFPFAVLSQDGPYDFARKNYGKANADSAVCAGMMKRLSKATIADATMNAYKGAVTATMANHITDKAEKLRLFKEGRSAMEQSIIKDSSNAELRFLRLTVQSNCPKALNYNKEIVSDKDYILKNFGSLNEDVRKMIREFAKQTSVFTPAEKKQLK